jgi:hypothetical protein
MSTTPEFIERQRLFLRRAGLTPQDIDARLIATLGETAGATSQRHDALSEFLLQFRDELGTAFTEVDVALQELKHAAATTLRPVRNAFRSIAIHAALIVGLAVFLISVSSILTTFKITYQTFGAELPTLTSWILKPIYSNVVLWLSVAGVFALFWQIRRMREWTMLERPGVGLWSEWLWQMAGLGAFWHVQVLAIVRAACRSGMKVEAALETARRIVVAWSGLSGPVDKVLAELRGPVSAAEDLGTLDAELVFQIEDRWRQLPAHMLERGELLALGVNVVLGILIGILVVALYLPLFKLASLV